MDNNELKIQSWKKLTETHILGNFYVLTAVNMQNDFYQPVFLDHQVNTIEIRLNMQNKQNLII